MWQFSKNSTFPPKKIFWREKNFFRAKISLFFVKFGEKLMTKYPKNTREFSGIFLRVSSGCGYPYNWFERASGRVFFVPDPSLLPGSTFTFYLPVVLMQQKYICTCTIMYNVHNHTRTSKWSHPIRALVIYKFYSKIFFYQESISDWIICSNLKKSTMVICTF